MEFFFQYTIAQNIYLTNTKLNSNVGRKRYDSILRNEKLPACEVPAKGQNLSRWMKTRCLTARLSLCHLCYRDIDCWLVSKLNLSYTHHWMSKPQLINIALDSWHSFPQQFVSRPHTYIFPLSKTSLTTLGSFCGLTFTNLHLHFFNFNHNQKCNFQNSMNSILWNK